MTKVVGLVGLIILIYRMSWLHIKRGKLYMFQKSVSWYSTTAVSRYSNTKTLIAQEPLKGFQKYFFCKSCLNKEYIFCHLQKSLNLFSKRSYLKTSGFNHCTLVFGYISVLSKLVGPVLFHTLSTFPIPWDLLNTHMTLHNPQGPFPTTVWPFSTPYGPFLTDWWPFPIPWRPFPTYSGDPF